MAKRCLNFFASLPRVPQRHSEFSLYYKHNWHYKLIYSYLKRQLLPPAQLSRSRCNLRRIKIFLRRSLLGTSSKCFDYSLAASSRILDVFALPARLHSAECSRDAEKAVESASAVYYIRIRAAEQIFQIWDFRKGIHSRNPDIRCLWMGLSTLILLSFFSYNVHWNR